MSGRLPTEGGADAGDNIVEHMLAEPYPRTSTSAGSGAVGQFLADMAGQQRLRSVVQHCPVAQAGPALGARASSASSSQLRNWNGGRAPQGAWEYIQKNGVAESVHGGRMVLSMKDADWPANTRKPRLQNQAQIYRWFGSPAAPLADLLRRMKSSASFAGWARLPGLHSGDYRCLDWAAFLMLNDLDEWELWWFPMWGQLLINHELAREGVTASAWVAVLEDWRPWRENPLSPFYFFVNWGYKGPAPPHQVRPFIASAAPEHPVTQELAQQWLTEQLRGGQQHSDKGGAAQQPLLEGLCSCVQHTRQPTQPARHGPQGRAQVQDATIQDGKAAASQAPDGAASQAPGRAANR